MPKSKIELRAFIAQATADFLAKGGKINVLTPVKRRADRIAPAVKSPLQAN